MYDIPTSVQIDGQQFHIRNNGDYRVILDCFGALEDSELAPAERLLASLFIFYGDFDSVEDLYTIEDIEPFVHKMFDFFNCGTDKSMGSQSGNSLIDWEADSQLICSAINKVAQKEIRLEPYIHWWTFMGYYSAVGDCPLTTIISIRDKIVKGKKLEKYEREFRRNNPQYFVWRSKSISQQEADKLAKELWNKEG